MAETNKNDEGGPLDVPLRIPREHVGRFLAHKGRIYAVKDSVAALSLILAGLEAVEGRLPVEPGEARS